MKLVTLHSLNQLATDSFLEVIEEFSLNKQMVQLISHIVDLVSLLSLSVVICKRDKTLSADLKVVMAICFLPQEPLVLFTN